MAVDLNAEEIAKLSIHQNERDIAIQVGQAEHRIALVKFWEISEGEKVLELGCGQGDATTVLASAVGEIGRVTAVDPGELTYGSPYNLGQAQGYISSGPVGKRVVFVQADPIKFLHDIQSTTASYDVAVLSHCIWYFASPTVLKDILHILANHAKRICIAEYALSASQPSMLPHVIAALAHASLQAHIPDSTNNIRTVLSPDAIKAIAQPFDLQVLKETTIAPSDRMFDGKWEAEAVLRKAFSEDVVTYVKEERARAVIFALRDSVKANRDILGGKSVNTMDVWAAVFTKR